MRIPCAVTLLSALAVSAVAHAATFNFNATGSGGGFSGAGSFVATDNGNGSFTITGISGAGITGLISPGGFAGNDNLLFPSSATLVDANGFAFTDTMGNTNFQVDISSTGVGTYQGSLLDSDGFSATFPATFSLTDTTTPEPSSLILLGTGLVGFVGLARRHILAR